MKTTNSGEGTTHDYASASETIAERASAYNMPGVRVDGMDVVEVYKAAQEAVERAKMVKPYAN